MNNAKSASGLLAQAAIRLDTVRKHAKSGNTAYAIRTAQECAELSLKAVLRFAGIDYPRRHDTGPVLQTFKERFPAWFDVDKMSRWNSWLVERREPSMYGVEEAGSNPEALFTRDDALTALKYSQDIFKSCKRVLLNSKKRKVKKQ